MLWNIVLCHNTNNMCVQYVCNIMLERFVVTIP